MEESRRLLGATRKSIQEIAGMAGFPDAAYFSRAFKERYGKSPMEYRKGI
ncbi:helix-turn-helix domain-containing protein [Blautia sp. RD014234]|nr:helix-turn-helix domain-containing protein [Blautia parvula]